MANTFNFGNGNWAQKTEKVLAYNAENNNYKPLPFDFDRGSTATRVNKQGLIETVGVDEPRIDFLNNTKGHLLLEPQRQNKITHYTPNSNWSAENGASITEDYNSSPDGTQNASRVQIPSGSLARVYSQFTVDANEDSVSFYIKSNTGSNFNIALFLRDAGFGTVRYQNTNLEVTTEWQRVKIENQDLSAASVQVMILFYNTLGSGVTWDFSLWGVQAEGGSYSTSIIPTSGSAVTRSAENCSGAGSSTVFNDSEGVFYVETEQFVDGDFESVYISLNQDGSSTNHLTIQHRDSGQLRVYANGFGTAELQFLENIDMAQNLKIAIQYKVSDYKLFVNGTQYSVYSGGGSQPAITGLNVVEFHVPTAVSQFWLGKVKDLRVYNTVLTDAELIALTT